MSTEEALEEVRSIMEQYQAEPATFGIDEEGHTIYIYTRKQAPATVQHLLEESGRRTGVHVVVTMTGRFKPAVANAL